MEGVQEVLVPGVPSLAPGCALSEATLGPRRQAQEMAREAGGALETGEANLL